MEFVTERKKVEQQKILKTNRVILYYANIAIGHYTCNKTSMIFTVRNKLYEYIFFLVECTIFTVNVFTVFT
jgi:hypothetical protein